MRRWSGRFLFFMTKDIPPTGVKLLEASQSTFVAMIGPYFDPRENGDVVTVFEGRRVERKISGKFNTRLVRGYRPLRRESSLQCARTRDARLIAVDRDLPRQRE